MRDGCSGPTLGDGGAFSSMALTTNGTSRAAGTRDAGAALAAAGGKAGAAWVAAGGGVDGAIAAGAVTRGCR